MKVFMNRKRYRLTLSMLVSLLMVFMVSCGVKEEVQTAKSTGSAGAQNLNKNNYTEGRDISTEPTTIDADTLQQGQGEIKEDEQAGKAKVEFSEEIRDSEELSLIKAQYKVDSQSSTEDMFFGCPDYIVEIKIPELYEKTKMKAYQAYTAEGKHTGNYLVYENTALWVLDSLEETCIVDIDQNGTYELLSLFGFGSGIYRIILNAYQVENPIYFNSLNKIIYRQFYNCFIPKQGYGKLVFNQVSDDEVHLVNVDAETGELGEDYGKLIIDKDMIHITLEDLEGFPYEIWDDVSNQENWKNEEFDYETLTEIPKLQVTVGDTIIKNSSWKKEWNKEEGEAIAFSDLMTEDIPLFTSPEEAYGSNQEICLNFGGVVPTSIQVMDSLITKDGKELYSDSEVLDRFVREKEKGIYCFNLEPHWALFLSSNTYTYTNPSYRGFRVICEFGENRSCIYAFVLSMGPLWVTDQP